MTYRGYVKNWRKIKDWGWYKTPHMAHLFQHLIREANHKPTMWRGEIIQPGQILTGRMQLAKDTGISERTIRTCIKRLKSTSEVTIKVTNQYSIITINNYKDYQVNDYEQVASEVTSDLANDCPATDQQVTTSNNEKNEKNEKNISIPDRVPRNGTPRTKISKPSFNSLDEIITDDQGRFLASQGISSIEEYEYLISEIDAWLNALPSRKRKYKDWPMMILNWRKKEIQKGLIWGCHPTEGFGYWKQYQIGAREK